MSAAVALLAKGQDVTPKKAAFIREYLVDLNATQAAIRAGYSKKTAYSAGQRLLKDVEAKREIAKAQMLAADKAEMTVDQHMADLKRIRDAAFDEGKFSAAAQAEMARGKVAGFYVDRMEANVNVKGSVAYKANMPQR